MMYPCLVHSERSRYNKNNIANTLFWITARELHLFSRPLHGNIIATICRGSLSYSDLLGFSNNIRQRATAGPTLTSIYLRRLCDYPMVHLTRDHLALFCSLTAIILCVKNRIVPTIHQIPSQGRYYCIQCSKSYHKSFLGH